MLLLLVLCLVDLPFGCGCYLLLFSGLHLLFCLKLCAYSLCLFVSCGAFAWVGFRLLHILLVVLFCFMGWLFVGLLLCLFIVVYTLLCF